MPECSMNDEQVEMLGGVCPECYHSTQDHPAHSDPAIKLSTYDSRRRRLLAERNGR